MDDDKNQKVVEGLEAREKRVSGEEEKDSQSDKKARY